TSQVWWRAPVVSATREAEAGEWHKPGRWTGSAQGSFAPGHGPLNRASPPPVSELDCAGATLLRKAHETAFFPWFRNSLLASGIGHQGYLLHAE
uniref:Uncharacterized protein n=1 Tax=Piliocolobus tephrosceles TaxID=591936 RepID=A0A8C9H4A1_9PRIM